MKDFLDNYSGVLLIVLAVLAVIVIAVVVVMILRNKKGLGKNDNRRGMPEQGRGYEPGRGYGDYGNRPGPGQNDRGPGPRGGADRGRDDYRPGRDDMGRGGDDYRPGRDDMGRGQEAAGRGQDNFRDYREDFRDYREDSRDYREDNGYGRQPQADPGRGQDNFRDYREDFRDYREDSRDYREDNGCGRQPQADTGRGRDNFRAYRDDYRDYREDNGYGRQPQADAEDASRFYNNATEVKLNSPNGNDRAGADLTENEGITFSMSDITNPDRWFSASLKESIVIGRSPVSDIVITDDRSVSGKHCIISHTGSEFAIIDNSSLNGTTLNGEKITGRAPLNNGDVIGIGRSKYRVKIADFSGY